MRRTRRRRRRKVKSALMYRLAISQGKTIISVIKKSQTIMKWLHTSHNVQVCKIVFKQCLLPGFASKPSAGRQDIQLCLMASQAWRTHLWSCNFREVKSAETTCIFRLIEGDILISITHKEQVSEKLDGSRIWSDCIGTTVKIRYTRKLKVMEWMGKEG